VKLGPLPLSLWNHQHITKTNLPTVIVTHHKVLVKHSSTISNSSSLPASLSPSSTSASLNQQPTAPAAHSHDHDLPTLKDIPIPLPLSSLHNQPQLQTFLNVYNTFLERKKLQLQENPQKIQREDTSNNSGNPEFMAFNKHASTIITDFTQYNLSTIEPDTLLAQADSIEKRVHAQRVVSTLIKTRIEAGDVDKSFDYFQLMQRYYLPVDENVYAMLREKIKEAFAALLSAAAAAAEGGSSKNPLPSRAVLNTIMNYFTETDRLADAFGLLACMKMSNLSPDVHTYKSLLNACMRYEDVSEAMLVFDMMRSDKVVLDIYTYERLFRLCASSVYPLGTQVVLGELSKHYVLSGFQRWGLITTMLMTALMKTFRMPKSVRGGRGWVTGTMLEGRFIFPPKTKNNKLLDPYPKMDKFLFKLMDAKYGMLPGQQISLPLLLMMGDKEEAGWEEESWESTSRQRGQNTSSYATVPIYVR